MSIELQNALKTALNNVEPARRVASGIWTVTKDNPSQVLLTTTPIFRSVTITCTKGRVSAHLVGHERMPPGGFEDRTINENSSSTAGCVYASVTFLDAGDKNSANAAGFYIVATE